MDKVPGVSLGTIIAFVAPGFIGLRALAYHLSTASAWFNAAVERDQGVGVFFFVLLASLAIGVVLSGVRTITLEPMLNWGFSHWRLEEPSWQYDLIASEPRRKVFEALVENKYKFYQFYGNSFAAIVVLMISHRLAGNVARWPVGLWVILGLSLLVLLCSARSQLADFYASASDLFRLGGSDGKEEEGR